MSLLTLFRQFTRVFQPRPPARGQSVLTSPETVWVVTAPNEMALVQPERALAIVHKRKLR